MAAENCERSHYFLAVNDFKVGSTSSQKDPHKTLDPHLDIFSRLLCFGFRLRVLVSVRCLFVDEEAEDSCNPGIYVLSFGQNAKLRKSKEAATESQGFFKHLTYFFLLDVNGALRRCQGSRQQGKGQPLHRHAVLTHTLACGGVYKCLWFCTQAMI